VHGRRRLRSAAPPSRPEKFKEYIKKVHTQRVG